MPWRFEQTGKTAESIIGRSWHDRAWHDVSVPIRQPRPQHKRGLTIFLTNSTVLCWNFMGGFYQSNALHCAPPRTSDGEDVCPEFIKFRKRLSFPAALDA